MKFNAELLADELKTHLRYAPFGEFTRIAREAGIAHSTLLRMRDAEVRNIDAILNLLVYLNWPLERFLGSTRQKDYIRV